MLAGRVNVGPWQESRLFPSWASPGKEVSGRCASLHVELRTFGHLQTPEPPVPKELLSRAVPLWREHAASPGPVVAHKGNVVVMGRSNRP